LAVELTEWSALTPGPEGILVEMKTPQRTRGKILILAEAAVLSVLLGRPLSLEGQGVKTWLGNELLEQIDASSLKLGPFSIRPVFYLSFAGLDSNVYRAADFPVEDFRTTLGPGFHVYLPIKRKIVFSVYESPQYVYFARTEHERSWNNYLDGRVSFILNRFFISLGKSYSVAREQWSTEIDIRPRRKENVTQGSFLWQVTRKTSLFLGLSRAQYEYEALSFGETIISQALNRTENRADLTGYYRLSYRTRFFLNFQFGQYKFQYLLNPRDSESNGVYAGLDFSPLGAVRGRINLGYKFFNVLVPGIEDYRGLVGDTNFSYRVAKPLIIRGSYAREVRFSTWYDYAYYTESISGVGASVYLTRNIRMDYNYRFGSNGYPDITQGQPSLQTRKDTYESHSAAIYFRVVNTVGLGLTASWWDRNSSIPWANAEQTLMGINLTYDF
jgi:hypothetical protein